MQYTGQMALPGTGLYHYRARAYHPGLGRFLQTDPVGYAEGMNLYAYVANDPVNQTDPTGMIAGDPGDRFGSPEEAIIDAADYIIDRSVSENEEYAFGVKTDGGSFYYDDPVKIGATGGSVDMTDVVYDGHSHGNYSRLEVGLDGVERRVATGDPATDEYSSDSFSAFDVREAARVGANNASFPSYIGSAVVGPSGQVTIITPPGAPTIIRGPTRSRYDNDPSPRGPRQ